METIDVVYTIFYTALSSCILLLIAILFQLFVLVFWKRVEGKITETSIEEKQASKGTRYFPKIKYTYMYGGMEHIGYSPWVIKQMYKKKETVQRVLENNQPGKSVKVLVNPLAAGQSALSHEVHPFYLIILLSAFVLIGLAAVFLYTNYQLTLF